MAAMATRANAARISISVWAACLPKRRSAWRYAGAMPPEYTKAPSNSRQAGTPSGFVGQAPSLRRLPGRPPLPGSPKIMNAHQPPTQSNRLAGLRRFAVAITLLNILGHTVFGFEQSWAQPLVSLAAAYTMEIILELAGGKNRRPRAWLSKDTIDFLLPAHITGLAVAMLLYANDRLWPIAFASAAAIGSKAIFRVGAGSRTRHFFNPSNFGISVTLLLFPWVGIAPPRHFAGQRAQPDRFWRGRGMRLLGPDDRARRVRTVLRSDNCLRPARSDSVLAGPESPAGTRAPRA